MEIITHNSEHTQSIRQKVAKIYAQCIREYMENLNLSKEQKIKLLESILSK